MEVEKLQFPDEALPDCDQEIIPSSPVLSTFV